MKDSTKMILVVTVLSSLIALSSAATADAQELIVPPAKNMLVRGAILCDSQQDLEVLLTGISLNKGRFPEEIPESCGRFMPEQPMPMVVTPTHWYETPVATTLIARFDHEPSGWTQFGWVAYILNPDYVPPMPDEES